MQSPARIVKTYRSFALSVDLIPTITALIEFFIIRLGCLILAKSFGAFKLLLAFRSEQFFN